MDLSDISSLPPLHPVLSVVQDDKWGGLNALEKENKSVALVGNQTTISRFPISLDIYGTAYDILAHYERMCGYELTN
jgi:hypothetical protein